MKVKERKFKKDVPGSVKLANEKLLETKAIWSGMPHLIVFLSAYLQWIYSDPPNKMLTYNS